MIVLRPLALVVLPALPRAGRAIVHVIAGPARPPGAPAMTPRQAREIAELRAFLERRGLTVEACEKDGASYRPRPSGEPRLRSSLGTSADERDACES